jgi:hypothetical protein
VPKAKVDHLYVRELRQHDIYMDATRLVFEFETDNGVHRHVPDPVATQAGASDFMLGLTQLTETWVRLNQPKTKRLHIPTGAYGRALVLTFRGPFLQCLEELPN